MQDEEPESATEPYLHGVHNAAPEVAVYVFEAQSVHEDEPWDRANEPGSHALQLEDPATLAKKPGTQAVQRLASVTFDADPKGHSSQLVKNGYSGALALVTFVKGLSIVMLR